MVQGCGEPLKRICYYASWGGVLPSPEHCTHVIYSFANMEGGVLSNVWSNPIKELRQKNSDIKLMVAVGGWSFGVTKMTEMLKDADSRFRFVNDSVQFLRKFEFDGLDLDFECNLFRFCFGKKLNFLFFLRSWYKYDRIQSFFSTRR